MANKEMTSCYLALGYFKIAPGVDFGKYTLECAGEHVALVALVVQAMEKDKGVRDVIIDAANFYKKNK